MFIRISIKCDITFPVWLYLLIASCFWYSPAGSCLHTAKSFVPNMQQSPQQGPLVPIMQDCVDAITEHQRLQALVKGEWVKGLLPQSSVRADYTVQRIRGRRNFVLISCDLHQIFCSGTSFIWYWFYCLHLTCLNFQSLQKELA
jgi:hypothetical protein